MPLHVSCNIIFVFNYCVTFRAVLSVQLALLRKVEKEKTCLRMSTYWFWCTGHDLVIIIMIMDERAQNVLGRRRSTSVEDMDACAFFPLLKQGRTLHSFKMDWFPSKFVLLAIVRVLCTTTIFLINDSEGSKWQQQICI